MINLDSTATLTSVNILDYAIPIPDEIENTLFESGKEHLFLKEI